MKLPEQVASDEEPSFAVCARCGACAAACPNDALIFDEFEVEIDGETVLETGSKLTHLNVINVEIV